MRHFLKTVVTAVLLGNLGSAFADPACGSDTSADPVAAIGKDVWLNGYCGGFLPCKQVLGLFHGCQAAESFLSKLGAREGSPLTESQVESALVRTTGKSSGASSCLWRFDAEQCRRYLGEGTATAETAVSAAPEPVRRPMTAGIARVERQRLSDMDARAEQVVSRSCGSWGCADLLENTVDPVIREAEALNGNAEYRAQLPPYEPIAAVEAAARLGWARKNGKWEQKTVASVTRIGGVTAEDCRRIHERLEHAISTNPSQEPTELAFFEAECMGVATEYPVAVRKWRTRLGATVAEAGSGARTLSRDPVVMAAGADIPMPALSRLDDWSSTALAEQQRIETEITVRKQRLEEEKVKAAAASRKGSPQYPAGSAASFDRTPRYNRSGSLFTSDFKGFMTAQKAVVDMPCGDAFVSVSNKLTTHMLEHSVKLLQGEAYDRVVEGGQRMDLSEAVLAVLQACGDSADVKTVRQRYITIYQDAAAYHAQLGASDSPPPAALDPAQAHDQCKALLDAAGQRVSRYTSAHPDSASGLMRVVMWADQEAIRIVEATCPDDPEYKGQLAALRDHLEQTGRSCGQLVSGGSCSPLAPD